MMRKLHKSMFKKVIMTLLVMGLAYALYPNFIKNPNAEASDNIVIGTPTNEELSILETASDLLTPYNYLNKQSLTANRLMQVTSNMALPSQYNDVFITWESSHDIVTIEDNISDFVVASPQGSLTIHVYQAIVASTPSIFQGAQKFELTATFNYHDVQLIKTYVGAVVPVMPDDFLGGVLFTAIRYASLFIEGVLTTLGLSLSGTIIGFALALVLVGLRLQKPTLRDKKITGLLKKVGSGFSKGYITIFRGTPMIVQASFFWYGLGLFNDALLCGLFVVSVNTAAYIAEILRGSIQSIDKGQTEAARSLGLTSIQTMRHIIFPQAIKNSMPAIGNEFVINIKDTAVLSVIGIFELFNQTTKIAGIHYRQLEAYLVVAIIYLVLTYSITWLLQRVEKKLDLQVIELPSSN
jgi:putative lysine transport system permease protein